MPHLVQPRLACPHVARSYGRNLLTALALALPLAVVSAHGRAADGPPLTVLSTATVGTWEIFAVRDSGGTEACIARRPLGSATSGQPQAMLFLRTKSSRALRIIANDWALPAGTVIPVTITAGERVRGMSNATLTSPHTLDVDLGDMLTTLQRIGEAPTIEIRLPGRTLTLPLDGMSDMRSALVTCISNQLGAQYAGIVEEPAVAPPDADVVEERTVITARIGAEDYRLETILVRPAGVVGRLPVALFAHGQPRADRMAGFSAAHLLPQARDLAHRGYLAAVVMRRGFGQSDGIPGLPGGARFDTCESIAETVFGASADELAAALAVVAARPDADASRTIVIGNSAGGPAALALAARGYPGVRAVIAVSGGVRCSANDPNQSVLRTADDWLAPLFESLGARAAVPSLWVYAANDSFFSGSMARAIHAAYAGAARAAGGGQTRFVMLPPIGDDGHDMFATWTGRDRWLTALDEFLHRHGLPTWSPAMVEAVMRQGGIAPEYRRDVVGFLSSIVPRVLVVDPATGKPYRGSVPFGLPAARFLAARSCQSGGGTDCVTVMENFRPLPATTEARGGRLPTP
ncbi:MAG: hypothetical protein GEU95_11645 [Rhizobiales bacterium]|nr:hypothetical protein [Hyphomicrobiales bacterium]